MQLVPDGPDVPLDLIEAQQDEQLVLFCGAGISKRAGLPLFGELVSQVSGDLGAPGGEPPTLDGDEPVPDDRRMLDLEQRFGRQALVDSVARRLRTPSGVELGTHEALLEIGRTPLGHRVVTTNFDSLFGDCLDGLEINVAPALPPPVRARWSTLVHLHGQLRSPSSIDNLVLTSADFGLAYLVDGWAARFVSELLRNFIVLFVGYSANDPVMRYILEAIESDRRKGKRFRSCFAFASRDEAWKAPGIRTIEYDPSGNHELLHSSLERWAHMCRLGITDRKHVVMSFSTRSPDSMPKEQQDFFVWALSDSDGACVSALRKRSQRLHPRWIPLLADAGFLTKPRSGAPLLFPMGGDYSHASVSSVLEESAMLLAEHLHQQPFAAWMVEAHADLHPVLERSINNQLERIDPGTGVAAFWRQIIDSRAVTRRPQPSTSRFIKPTSPMEWTRAMTEELIACLDVYLRFGPAWPNLETMQPIVGNDEDAAVPNAPASWGVSDVASVECHLRAGGEATLVIDDVVRRDDFPSVAASIALPLWATLDKALRLLASVGLASDSRDGSEIMRPSIAPHSQNSAREGDWIALVDFMRRVCDEIAQASPGTLRSLAAVWRETPFPLARRLLLYCSQTHGIPALRESLAEVLAEPRDYLWAPSVQVEFSRMLGKLWGAARRNERFRLLREVCSGPPREIFRPGIEADQLRSTTDRYVWEWLTKMGRIGAGLTKEALKKLASISMRHPEWGMPDGERAHFTSWHETWSGFRTDVTPDEFASMTVDEVVEALTSGSSDPILSEGRPHAWQQAIAGSRELAVGVLDKLALQTDLPRQALSCTLEGLLALKDRETTAHLLRLLSELSEDVKRDVVHDLTHLLREAQRAHPKDLRGEVLEAVASLLPVARATPFRSEGDPLTAAINHPLGSLCDTVIDALAALEPTYDSGLPDDVRVALGSILGGGAGVANPGEVVAGRRLYLLYYVDADWTRERLISRFSWRTPDVAGFMWRAFLGGASGSPALWAELKEELLLCFAHQHLLSSSTRDLAFILGSVIVDATDYFSIEETRECLRRLTDEGRSTVAWYLRRRVDEFGDKKPSLWEARLRDRLGACWPRDVDCMGPASSAELAKLCVALGDEFADAVAVLKDRMGHTTKLDGVVHEVLEAKVASAEPDACLTLLHTLTPEQAERWVYHELPKVLGVIARESDLKGDARMVRLRRILGQNGLDD